MAKNSPSSETHNRKLQDDGFILLDMVPKTSQGERAIKKYRRRFRQGCYEEIKLVDGNDAIRGSGYKLLHPKTFVYALPQSYDPVRGKPMANTGLVELIHEATGRRCSDVHVFAL